LDVTTRIEAELLASLATLDSPATPPLLAQAMRHAVVPGGARLRPRLCVTVAQACGAEELEVALAAAVAIELHHCASLVHDDLPCFDNADMRRGRLSVHKAYGDQVALLAGDGLIVLGFQRLAALSATAPLGALLGVIADAIGSVRGLVAGQAWECEPKVSLTHYQQAKTGALFVAATMAGALAAASDPIPWRIPGERLGEAYQVADDIHDVVAEPGEIGKPVGRDSALGRPNAVARYGLSGACARLENLVSEALELIPRCPGAQTVQALILSEAGRLLPKKLRRAA
jgi:geranylgeranyl diphosphate synthase, type II